MTSIDRASDQIVQNYRGQQIVIITDVHPQMDHVAKLGFETARRMGVPIGMETLMPAQQPLIDALATGDITREDFLKMMTPSDNKGAFTGSPENYMGTKRAQEYFENIADEIQAGTRILAVGTVQGMNKFTDNPENAKLMENYLNEVGIYNLDHMKFHKKNDDEIDADPREFFYKYSQQIHNVLDTLPPEQQAKFIAKMQEVRDDEVLQTATDESYKKAIDDLHSLSHPRDALYDQANKAVDEKVSKFGGITPKTLGGYNLVEGRQRSDPQIAERIDQAYQRHGPMVVVYGVLHTTHDNDMDANLRAKGRRTMIIDAGQASPENMCRPLDPGAIPMAGQCEDMQAIYAHIRRQTHDSGDVERFQVTLDKPEPEVERVSRFQHLDKMPSFN